MRLLPSEAFTEVFQPLVGRRIGYIRPLGNVGDALIELATLQMFDEFGIDWRLQDPAGPVGTELDTLVFGGGGNMGARYRNNWELRGRILSLGLPVIIFPQTFSAPEERPYQRIFVRERVSLSYCPQATLAPDLALGLRHLDRTAPTRGTGVFLRRDQERAAKRRWFARDPAKICSTPQQYFALAARYERIVTDRLHFAICGLILGRETTLLPNDYHKNESMYDTWLKGLGCRFARNVMAAA
jgi:exopolysaccharide biosynthesis predicted pyruvyltransferase EpsI